MKDSAQDAGGDWLDLEEVVRSALRRRAEKGGEADAGDECSAEVLAVAFPDGARAAAMLGRARALFRTERPGVLRLAVQRLARTLEVLEAIGDVLTPVPVRGDADDGVLVRHRFGDREVAAHVCAGDGLRFLVTLDLQPPVDAQPVRVSLFRGHRELMSEVARRGRVTFPELPPGRYRVTLTTGQERFGELDLSFAAAAA